MRSSAQLGRLGVLVVFGVAAAEVLIMISPFAGFFYASLRFEPLLGVLSRSRPTAWLDGFFPKSEAWMARVFRAALAHEEVRRRLVEVRGDHPLAATILPPRYGMKGMYYKLPDGHTAGHTDGPLMGVDPESTDEPVELVFSRVEKPYRKGLVLEDALDVDVRLTPLLVVSIRPARGEVMAVRVPLPRNAWGPKVVMPLF
jgi:hypothetical protein